MTKSEYSIVLNMLVFTVASIEAAIPSLISASVGSGPLRESIKSLCESTDVASACLSEGHLALCETSMHDQQGLARFGEYIQAQSLRVAGIVEQLSAVKDSCARFKAPASVALAG